MRLIDTHCHLNDPKAFPDPAATVQEATEAGVEKLVVVGVDTASSQAAVSLAEQFEPVYAVVGWHPTYTSNCTEQALAEIESLLQHPKVVAIGEIGLDYYWDHATHEEQHRALHAQLELAESTNTPVVYHCREAEDALLSILEERPKTVPYLFHCFAGNTNHAQRAVALGGIFGVDGPVTYKSRDDLRTVLKAIGLDRIVIETDSPYMTPAPHRGKPNQPSWVVHVNQGLAGTFETSPKVTAETTTRIAEKFFQF